MPRDSQPKMSKKESIKSKKREAEARKKKKNEESSSSEDDTSFYTDDEDDEMDVHEYRKFLKKMFPSKHLDNKIKAGERVKKAIKNEKEDDDEDEEEDEEEEEIITKKKSKKQNKKVSTKDKNKKKKQDSEDEEEEEEEIVTKKSSRRRNKKVVVSDEDEEEDEDEDDDDEETLGSEDTDEDEKHHKHSKFNIIFTIGGASEDEDEYEDEFEDDEDWATCSETDTENEDDPISSDSDEEENETEDEEEEEEEQKEEVLPRSKKIVKKTDKKNTDKNKTDKKTTKEMIETNLISTNTEDNKPILDQLKDMLAKNPNDKSIEKCIEVYEENAKKEKAKKEKKVKKEKDRNGRIFKRIMRDKNTMNDFEFYDKLELVEQKKIIKELREINKITRVEKPYRLTLLESDIPTIFKAAAMKKISSLRYMEPGSGEYYKIKNWVDTFMRIPFSKHNTLPISITDGVDKCHDFMANAQKILDEAVYGLNDAKMQIMQMLGQLLTNPKAIGTAIAIHGPPGTGKCHTLNTPILMYDGSIKMVQDIVVGDNVMGDDSTPRKVIDLGRGEDELFEIIPRKGDKFGVNSEHILCLKQSGLNKIKKIINNDKTISYKVEYLNKVTYKLESKRIHDFEEAEKYLYDKSMENDIIEISVKKLLSLPKSIYSKLKGYRTGVEFESQPVLFDPYILGVWLGDGTTSKPEITNQDANILCHVRNSIKKYNLNLNYYSQYTYRISYDMYDNDSRNNKNMFLQALKDYNLLNNKHIPNQLKFNDRNVRLQLLAGILDTDGSYSQKDKCFDIIQKNKILSDDILFIARSLGFGAYQKKCNKLCNYKGNKITGEYYRISISGDNLCDIPTKCPRKRAIERKINKNALVFGFDVKPIGIGKYYGFTLDNNHRYLLHDFTVTHNTSLVKEGISKILNRPFAFIALGGATDSSFLEGHGYTYEGSTWGKIVQILIDSKCMNPVIYFDELDKISDTPKGEEIAGILTHLTDTSQNTQFHDKYFAEIDFDLSKCLFIFSYNDESKVNPILKDRMYRIQTKGYNQKQKTVIANDYLLPKIREQVVFEKEDIIIPEQTLHYIIENHCNKEDGVRNLKRCLEIIYTKLNLYRLMRPDSNLFEEDMSLKVEFPFTVTKDIVDKLVKKSDNGLSPSLYMLYT
jgi:ATP-dependent Lon protease